MVPSEPLRGSDTLKISRKEGDGIYHDYDISLDDVLKFLTSKIREINKEDIAGVLSRTLREKAAIVHRHSVEDIKDMASALGDHCCDHNSDTVINRNYIFSVEEW